MFDLQGVIKHLLYPEPGSNRHELLHWCLRPTRLPIPPSGHGRERSEKTMKLVLFRFAGAKLKIIGEITKYLFEKLSFYDICGNAQRRHLEGNNT